MNRYFGNRAVLKSTPQKKKKKVAFIILKTLLRVPAAGIHPGKDRATHQNLGGAATSESRLLRGTPALPTGQKVSVFQQPRS